MNDLRLSTSLFQLLMERFLPTLVSIFQAPPEKTPLGINAVSISVVINASDQKKKKKKPKWGFGGQNWRRIKQITFLTLETLTRIISVFYAAV